MTAPVTPVTWNNPFYASLTGPDSQTLQAIFKNLSDWLQNPYFPKGIQVGLTGNPSLSGDVKIPEPSFLITKSGGPPVTADGQLPSGLTGGGGIRSVTVFWTGPANAAYEVQLSTNNTFTAIIRDVNVTGIVTSFTDLNPSTTYYARVRGIGTAGGANSAWGSTITVSTGVIGTADIAANTITAAMIQAGVITSDRIAASGIVGDKIVGGTITGTTIGAVNIYGPHISTAAVGYTGNHIELDGTNYYADGTHTLRFYSGNASETGVGSIRVQSGGTMVISAPGISSAPQRLLTISGDVQFNIGGGSTLTFDYSSPNTRIYSGGTMVKLLGGSTTIQCRNGSDSGYGNFQGTSFDVVSSEVLKQDITPAQTALPLVTATPMYEWAYTSEPSRRRVGPVIERFCPTALVHDGAVGLADMVGILWKAVQELAAEVAALKGTTGANH